MYIPWILAGGLSWSPWTHSVKEALRKLNWGRGERAARCHRACAAHAPPQGWEFSLCPLAILVGAPKLSPHHLHLETLEFLANSMLREAPLPLLCPSKCWLPLVSHPLNKRGASPHLFLSSGHGLPICGYLYNTHVHIHVHRHTCTHIFFPSI